MRFDLQDRVPFQRQLLEQIGRDFLGVRFQGLLSRRCDIIFHLNELFPIRFVAVVNSFSNLCAQFGGWRELEPILETYLPGLRIATRIRSGMEQSYQFGGPREAAHSKSPCYFQLGGRDDGRLATIYDVENVTHCLKMTM